MKIAVYTNIKMYDLPCLLPDFITVDRRLKTVANLSYLLKRYNKIVGCAAELKHDCRITQHGPVQ